MTARGGSTRRGRFWLVLGLVGVVALIGTVSLRDRPAPAPPPPAPEPSRDGASPGPPAARSLPPRAGQDPVPQGAVQPEAPPSAGTTTKVRYRGTVEMDPALLEGRDAFILACGDAAPLLADLRFELETEGTSCMARVLLVGPGGKVAYGQFHPIKPRPHTDGGGLAVTDLHLVGPTMADQDDWSVLLLIERNIIANHVESCKKNYEEAFATVAECVQTTAGQHIDDLAWLEEMGPIVGAVSGPGSPDGL
jgi:hypothetical protein